MSWLDDILGTVFRVNGAEAVTRRIVDFVAGPNVTLTQVDDSNSEKTVISIGAGTGIGGVVTALLAGLAPSFTAGTAGILKTDGTTPSWGRVTAALLDSGIPVAKLGSYSAGDAGKVLTVDGTGAVVASAAVSGEVLMSFGQATPSAEFVLTSGFYQQTSVAAQGSIWYPLRVEVGRKASQVKLWLQPGTHTAMPATKPTVDFQRRSMTGTSPGTWSAVDGFSAVTDPLTYFAAYNNLHAITLTSNTPGGTPLVSGYEYRVIVYGETGTNSVTGLRIYDLAVTYVT